MFTQYLIIVFSHYVYQLGLATMFNQSLAIKFNHYVYLRFNYYV